MQDGDKKESPFFCNIKALNSEQRKRMGELVNRMNAKRQQVKELPDGYAFRFAGEPELVKDLAEFAIYEKMCCPFFDFEIALERENGPLWLRLKGREGVKAFIKMEFGL
jgi:hypothetical protein